MTLKSSVRLTLTALVLGGAALVGGCWDDDDGDSVSAPVTQVPASAGASVGDFIAFIRGLVSDETSEPLEIPTGFTAPVTEVSEPAA